MRKRFGFYIFSFIATTEKAYSISWTHDNDLYKIIGMNYFIFISVAFLRSIVGDRCSPYGSYWFSSCTTHVIGLVNAMVITIFRLRHLAGLNL